MPCRIAPPAPAPPARPLPEPLAWVAADLEALRDEGLERPVRVRDGRQGAVVTVDGRPLRNFGSNDYLGYAADVRLARAAAKAACAEGTGSGASPLVSGHSRAHEALERALASLLAVDAALVFPSGYAANTATIAALVGRGDVVFSDERNHASIIDGCRLSQATVRVYPHRDAAALDVLMAGEPHARRKLVVSDTLFSMDGTAARLPDLCAVAERHGAMLMVDEAHATGVCGARGSGLVEETGCAAGVHVRVGTLSKALGSAGGFVAGPAELVHWLRHKARAWMFSTAHPPAAAAAATCTIALLETEPDRRRCLRDRSAAFRERLAGAGLDVGGACAQIVPVVAGAAAAAVELADRLAAAGSVVPAIRPPSVPRGQSIVRVSLSWLHDDDHLDGLAAALVRHAP